MLHLLLLIVLMIQNLGPHITSLKNQVLLNFYCDDANNRAAVHHRQRGGVVARGTLLPAHLRPLHRGHGLQLQHRGVGKGKAAGPCILGSGSFY